MIPAFPLDGGRVLRSILWQVQGSLRWSTRITSSIGSGFGPVLILLGVLNFVGGNIVGGMWQFLIGMFLRGAAQMSYQQVLIRRALEGESIVRFMQTLSRMNQGSISRLMVVQNDPLEGIVSLKDLLKFIALKVELEEGHTESPRR